METDSYEKMTDDQALSELVTNLRRRAGARGYERSRWRRYLMALENLFVPRHERVSRRDRKKPFDTEELERIEEDARLHGDEVLEQLAGTVLVIDRFIEKQSDTMNLLARKVRLYLDITCAQVGDNTILARLRDDLEKMASGVLGDGGEEELEVTRINWEENTPFSITMRTNWALEVISASLAKMLKKPDGTWWNNLTMVLHYLGEQFDVTVQRRDGKSVKDQLNEAEARIKQLESEVVDYKKYYDADYK